jgi:hypothetical protein
MALLPIRQGNFLSKTVECSLHSIPLDICPTASCVFLCTAVPATPSILPEADQSSQTTRSGTELSTAIDGVDKTLTGPLHQSRQKEEQQGGPQTLGSNCADSHSGSEQSEAVVESVEPSPIQIMHHARIQSQNQPLFQPLFQSSSLSQLQPQTQTPSRAMPEVTPVDSFQDSDDSPPHAGGSSEPRASKFSPEENTASNKHGAPPSDSDLPSKGNVELKSGNSEVAEPEPKCNTELTPEPENASTPENGNSSGAPTRSPSAKSNKRRASDSIPEAGEISSQPKKAVKTSVNEPQDLVTEDNIKVSGRAARSGLRSLFLKTGPAPGPKIFEDHRMEPKPEAANGTAALPKNWQFPQVLTSKQSPLVKHSGLIAQILESDEAWASLTTEQRLHLHSMLWNLDPRIREDGKHESPMVYLMSTKQKESWQRDVETVERDIQEGRMDPKWRAKAEAAFESRLKGDLLDDAQKAAKRRREEREGGGVVNTQIGNNEDDEAAENSRSKSSQETKRNRMTQSRDYDSEEDDGEQEDDEDGEFAPKPTSIQKPASKRTQKAKTSSSSKQLKPSKHKK